MPIKLHFIAFIFSAPIAFIFSKAKRTWVPVAGLFLGWLIGFIVTLLFGLLVNKGDATSQISTMAQAFWVTFVFSCLATYFGRKNTKQRCSVNIYKIDRMVDCFNSYKIFKKIGKMMSNDIDPKQVFNSLIFKQLKSTEFSTTSFSNYCDNNRCSILQVVGICELFLQTARDDNEKTCEQAHDEILSILRTLCGLAING